MCIRDSRSTGHSLAPNRRVTFPEEKYVNQLHLRTLKDGSIASDAVNSIFRGIQISDSLSIPDNCMMLAGKTDSATDGGTHSINLCRECAAPGTAIRFKLTLDQSVLKGRKMCIRDRPCTVQAGSVATTVHRAINSCARC